MFTEDSVLGMAEWSGLVRKKTVLGGKILRRWRKNDPDSLFELSRDILKKALGLKVPDKKYRLPIRRHK